MPNVFSSLDYAVEYIAADKPAATAKMALIIWNATLKWVKFEMALRKCKYKLSANCNWGHPR
jgi:hypothetical protein